LAGMLFVVARATCLEALEASALARLDEATRAAHGARRWPFPAVPEPTGKGSPPSWGR